MQFLNSLNFCVSENKFKKMPNFTRNLLFILTISFIVFSAITAISAQTDEEEIIKVESSLVVLNTTITDENGDPVNSLNEGSFEIFEDGVKQKVAFFEAHETPFAAVILIDTSGSMETRVSMARAATIKFLSGLRADDTAAIYNFDSKVSMVQDFSNLRDLTPQVFNLKAYGWTVLNDAVYEAAKKLETREEKRKAIIVLSDGADTRSGRSASKALKAALKANVTIYSVDMSAINTGGKRRMQNQGVLRKFARKTGGKFVKTPGGIEMRSAFENIVKDLGVQYTIGYYPQNTKKDGKWRKIEVRVPDQNLNIRTREGYNAPKN